MKGFKIKEKKGQIEILGIAIVVVLLLVGMMLFFMFIIPSGQRSLALDVAQTEIGANTINTLIKTTTTCKNLNFGELIVDCAEGSNVECSGETSCAFVNSELRSILDKTLVNWGYDFDFKVLVQEDSEFVETDISYAQGICIEKEHFEQIMPTYLSLVKVSLDLC